MGWSLVQLFVIWVKEIFSLCFLVFFFSTCYYILVNVCNVIVKGEGLSSWVFKTTFNKISVISWKSVLWVKETRLHRESYPPVTISLTNLTPWMAIKLTTLMGIGTDFIGRCKFSYLMIMDRGVPSFYVTLY